MAWGGKTNLIEVVTQSYGTFVVAVRGYQRWKEKGLPWELGVQIRKISNSE